MGNREHMDRILNCTVEEWNKWRQSNLKIKPDLTRIDLTGRDLTGIDFRGVGLFKANFTNAILKEANLRQATAVKANFSGADLSNACVYGISAWDITTDENTKQIDLVITEPSAPKITVDNLQLAQFLHLLINNKNIRDVIQAVSNKAILILGRFAGDHIKALIELKNALRNSNHIPILFDFKKPSNRNLTETVITLASLSKLVICDLTYSASVAHELHATVPNFNSIPFQPIIKQGNNPYDMFESIQKYSWVRDITYYDSMSDVINMLPDILKK